MDTNILIRGLDLELIGLGVELHERDRCIQQEHLLRPFSLL